VIRFGTNVIVITRSRTITEVEREAGFPQTD
jgi:hypothetical protein